MALEINGKEITEIRLGGELVIKQDDMVELEFVWGTYTPMLAKFWVGRNMGLEGYFTKLIKIIDKIGMPMVNGEKWAFRVDDFTQHRLDGVVNIFDDNGNEISDKIVILENDGCLVKESTGYWKVVRKGKAKIQVNA